MDLKLKNITLRVSDMDEAKAFYEGALGLPKRWGWPNFVVFDVGGVRFSLAPGGRRGPKEDAPDIEFLVDDVDDTYNVLRGRGVKFLGEPKDQYWGGRTATFLDPDENRFTLVQLKK